MRTGFILYSNGQSFTVPHSCTRMVLISLRDLIKGWMLPCLRSIMVPSESAMMVLLATSPASTCGRYRFFQISWRYWRLILEMRPEICFHGKAWGHRSSRKCLQKLALRLVANDLVRSQSDSIANNPHFPHLFTREKMFSRHILKITRRPKIIGNMIFSIFCIF